MHISQGFYRFRFLFFFHFLGQMSVYLLNYPKRMLYPEQQTVLLAQRQLNAIILTNIENLNSTLNIFQETHNVLVLIDSVIICIYLRTTDRPLGDQGNFRHPISEVRKCDLVQTINKFQNPSLRIFAFLHFCVSFL